jgi:predicted alpha/beta hydrolase family esterase
VSWYNTLMKKALILHGTSATPQSNWFAWLKDALESIGYIVWLPQLPSADTPNAQQYTEFLLANHEFTFDNETIIIGHSSGAVEILHLLQHLPANTTIKAAFLVSAFKDNLGWEALQGLFTEPFDFVRVKQHCSKFVYLHADNDPYCDLEHAKYLAAQTGGELHIRSGQGHFNTELGPQYTQFPELLRLIIKTV